MTGPVLNHLGKTWLELGPARTAESDGPWRAARDAQGILWMALDVEEAGANTVSRDVLEGLDRQLDAIAEDPPEGVVIRSAKIGSFAVGADINMFRDLKDADDFKTMLDEGHAVLDRLEALECPTVCVVHGQALGGGFEIALACDRIIAVNGASFGFPEVNLGLHPGLGGTFRLTERIDPIEAMTLMLTGKTAHTKKAKALGIVETIVEERHVEAAVRDAINGNRKHDGPSLKDRAMALSPARRLAARKMRSTVKERASRDHYPAPYALIELWETHGGDRNEMQRAEIASFADLVTNETSRNLVRVFFLRQALKNDGDGQDGITHVHVVGAGTMGGEIAAWCALNGKSVTFSDPDLKALGQTIRRAGDICKDQHLSGIENRDTLDRLMPDPDGLGVPKADLVIEAGPEDAEIKRKIYAGIEPRMNPTATLVTNSSSLSITELAKTLKRPRRFAGLHFFNPVSKMQLVEVVSHDALYGAVADRLAAFCGTIGRLPARVGDYSGYLVNRALTPYLLEAIQLIEEGHAKETIDAAAEAFGMPMGPVELADQIGLDICLHVAESLKSGLSKPMVEIPGWLTDKIENGDLGKKSGRGFYDWTDGKADKGAASNPETAQAITDRLILPILDACVECLREGIAHDSDQVDGALIFGTGFAPFRGGPMHYARSRGVDEVVARLTELAESHGDRFRPDPGWKDLD
ncbi:3-hydroxyacyl-CoA dehydrogenase / enoyl-CoA hydratase / 3-hydroxybutyryl-CoA epimerase [Salinihabitans flavidus]|uniref:3-hydroxyacyl-CoA dehydrogenase / enoyl-CoA hydratase / 3-hydroxybutyryl-CoA epimerase n=1 Tax=Salinihabitans flavidus TaxID=569882 RepID=A0A1H8UWZ4_9RHOB|nr:3-hydroxyacyl-CoA dehydrogenase NAD-binding domain-containing protein [Salinihabitans flavidus]SEP07689.1 3-hydroxyacyl-CoA dehydrogenase / enoyl-CoA hydratase / 3-hydroxybutyryl-CoA epimerase [Salinihabitans flavidus]